MESLKSFQAFLARYIYLLLNLLNFSHFKTKEKSLNLLFNYLNPEVKERGDCKTIAQDRGILYFAVAPVFIPKVFGLKII